MFASALLGSRQSAVHVPQDAPPAPITGYWPSLPALLAAAAPDINSTQARWLV
jgi:hypothetical protein